MGDALQINAGAATQGEAAMAQGDVTMTQAEAAATTQAEAGMMALAEAAMTQAEAGATQAEAATTQAAAATTQAEASDNGGGTGEVKYICPICGESRSRRYTIKTHFPGCVKKHGNPQGLEWTDHPSTKAHRARKQSGWNTDRKAWLDAKDQGEPDA